MTEEMAAVRNEPRESAPPTLRDLLAIIFRQRRVAVSTFLVVLALTAVYAWLTPAYQAHMKVLLRRGRIDAVVSPEQDSPIALVRPEISEEELNSEVELLRDQELLQKVVEQNGLAGPAAAKSSKPADGQQEIRVARAVRTLAGHLEVAAVRKTNLISVTYESSDPAAGARVLRTLATAYVEKHKAVRRSAEELPFFEQQAQRSRGQLDAAETRLLDFSQEGGVVSGALERDLALQRAGEIESGHQQALIAIQEVSRRAQELRGKLKSLPERSTSEIRTSDNPQLLETLKGKLLELELKKTEMLTKFQPSYPLVQQVQEQIDQARASIAAEQLAPVREETTEKDPNYEWTKSELGKAEVELGALCARERAIRSELAGARGQARELGEASIHQQDLLRGMKTAEESYLLYAKKSEEARISDALDERGIVNVILAEPPVAPVLPKHSVWVWLTLGLAMATTASVAVTFAVDYIDPAFRTPEDVVACLRAPVLASLPREAA
jgi:uncharacterized protein involved in exopolysaccharide biosynthesis